MLQVFRFGEDALKETKATRVTVNLREDEHAELVRLAQEHDVSISRITRQAVTEFLERYGKGESQLTLSFAETPRSANG